MNISPLIQKIADILSKHEMGPPPGSDLSNPETVAALFNQTIALLNESEDRAEVREIAHLFTGLYKALYNPGGVIWETNDEYLDEPPRNLTQEALDIARLANKQFHTLDTTVLTDAPADTFSESLFSYLDHDEPISLTPLIENAGVKPEDKELAKSILDEIIACMRENRGPRFSSLFKTRSRDIALLFKLVDFLSMANFQRMYLEPFNKKFPGIPLNQTPKTVFELHVSEDITNFKFSQTVENVESSLFPRLENTDLSKAGGLTKEHLIEISKSETLRVLSLPSYFNILDIDPALFPNIEELDLYDVKNMTQAHVDHLARFQNLRVLRLPEDWDISNITFPKFPNLEEVRLSTNTFRKKHLAQLSESKKLRILELHCAFNVGDFDFGQLPNLEEIDLSFIRDLTPDHLAQLAESKKLRVLILPLNFNVTDVDFRLFPNLGKIGFLSTKNLTQAHIDQLPVTLEELDLYFIDISSLDLKRLAHLKTISINRVQGLTVERREELKKLGVQIIGAD